MKAPYGNLPPPQPRFYRPLLSASLRIAGASLRRMFFLLIWIMVMVVCVPWAVYYSGRNLGYFFSDEEVRSSKYRWAVSYEQGDDIELAWKNLTEAQLRSGSIPGDSDLAILQAKILIRKGRADAAKLTLRNYRARLRKPQERALFQQQLSSYVNDSLDRLLQSPTPAALPKLEVIEKLANISELNTKAINAQIQAIQFALKHIDTIGQWKTFSETDGKPVIVSLNSDGSAISTNNRLGTWKAADNKTSWLNRAKVVPKAIFEIAWNDKWFDIICVEGTELSRHCYVPGQDRTLKASYRQKILKIEN